MNIRRAALICACFGLSAMTFGCGDDGGGLFTKCDAGTTRCNGDAMEACAIVSWQKAVDCPMGCDEATGQCKLPEGQECVTTICSGNVLKKCGADFKITEEPCAAGMECVVNQCQPKQEAATCTPNEVKCSGDNTGTQTCTAEGKWADPVACDANKVCDGTLRTCVEQTVAVICNQGEKECVGTDSYRVCDNNEWGSPISCGENMVCEDAGVCNAAPAPEKVCDEEATRCTEDHTGTQTCVENAWTDPVACGENELCDREKNTCVPAEEAKICEAEAKECVSENSIKVCSAEGKWGEEGACPEDAPVCKNNECVPEEAPIEAKCTAGDKKCSDDGSKQLVCEGEGNDADWKEIECSTVGEGYVCDASKECVAPAQQAVCQKGEIKCGDRGQNGQPDKYIKCLDDGSNWAKDQTRCDNKTPRCDAGITPVACVEACQNNATRCSAEGKVQRCNNGAWQDRGPQNQCSEMEKCVYDETAKAASCKCTHGMTKCGNTMMNATQISTCKEDGTWSDFAKCEQDGYLCSNNECVAPCNPGEKKCADGKLMTCTQNRTWNETACATKETCVEDNVAKSASCVCEAGAKSCGRTQRGESVVRTCVNGQWQNGETCQNGCDAETGACLECGEDGTRQCTEAGMFQICKDHKWVDVEDCGAANKCVRDNRTVVGCCNDKAVACSVDNKSIVACKQKTSSVNDIKYFGWEETTTCEGGECKINAQTKAPVCSCAANTPNKCEDNNVMMCKAGEWVVLEECKAGYTCDASQNTCVCTEGAFRCITQNNETTRQVCKNNKWEKTNACADGQRCNLDTGLCMANVCDRNAAPQCIASNVLIKCENRQYVATTCQNNQVCVETNNIGTCQQADNTRHQNGETRCSYDNKSLETWQQQGNGGKWNATSCNGNVCKVGNNRQAACSNEKVACDYGKYSCDKDKLQFCGNDNKLVDVADCASNGLTCKDGACVAK